MTELPVRGDSPSLLTAVRELTGEVKALRKQLATEYPKRDEVRREGRERALRFLALSVVILLVSQCLTVTLISHCFLGDTTRVQAPCGAIPGYAEKVDESNKTMTEFYRLINQIEENRKDVAELQLEIEKIKASRPK